MIATVNGARLAYDLEGRGPALVFLHEGIADRTMWANEVRDLVRDHRVLNLDLRGYGESDLPPGPAAWHEDVAALMGEVGIARGTLIGGSMGASIAVNVALSHREAVAALVLVGPGLGGRSTPADLRETIDAIDALAASGDLERAAEETVRLWVDGPTRPRGTLSGARRDELRRMNVDILRREQSATGVEVRALEPPAATRLHEIAVPTLVIVGGDDVPFIQENARFITERVRGSELVVFADAAHMPNLDHPDGFLDVVRAFLRRNGL